MGSLRPWHWTHNAKCGIIVDVGQPDSQADLLDGDTFRAVYTVRFAESVYVLHVFQKKSKRGIQTPKHVMALIKARVRQVEREHQERREAQ